MKILREEDMIPMTRSYNAMTSSVFADVEFLPAMRNKMSEPKRTAESMASCIAVRTITSKGFFSAVLVVAFIDDRKDAEKKLKNTSLNGGAKLDSNDTEVLSLSLWDVKMASSMIFSPNNRTSSRVKLPGSLSVKLNFSAALCNRLDISARISSDKGNDEVSIPESDCTILGSPLFEKEDVVWIASIKDLNASLGSTAFKLSIKRN